jgi:hypothetical protein
MRIMVPIALAAAVSIAACNRHRDEGNDTLRHSADTSVTTRKVQDTTIVTHDTVVHSDTIKKMGGMHPTAADSARRRAKP